MATNLKDDCLFYVGFGEVSKQMHPPGQPIIVFRPDLKRSNDMDETFTGNLNNFDELHIWVSEKCVPLVREITFENAEELTEEGLPFLILFYHPDQLDIIKQFNDIVQTELITEKRKYVNVKYTECVVNQGIFNFFQRTSISSRRTDGNLHIRCII